MLHCLVFVSGMTVLGAELTGSRLLAPYFGTSLLIWANVIGLVLLYLTVGYWLGGRLADRYPQRETLYHVTAVAAVFVGLIPVLARPVLALAAVGMATYSVGIFWGSLLGVLGLFLIPITLLGCVSPWAVRLAVSDVGHAGATAGRLYALSTVGSLAGAYLPVLVLVPTVGTARTFVVLATGLLLVSVAGLVRERLARARPARERRLARARGALLGVYLAALLVLVGLALLPRGVVRAQPYGELLYETESAYNYIQVVKTGTRTELILNEGHAVHSVYDPTTLLTGGYWDHVLVAPFFQPGTREADVDSLLLLGSAAGTTARQYTAVFGPLPIDGVELDPQIIAVGRRFFGMTWPNLTAIPQDARAYLRTTPRRYRVVVVDVFRQPYIPFHLTTREFFAEVKAHLEPGGVVTINVGRTASDYRLVDVLAATMRAVYPHVFVVDVPDSINSVVIATTGPSDLPRVRAGLAALHHPVLRRVAGVAAGACEYDPPAGAAGEGCPFAGTAGRAVLTDDLAPVEQLIDQIILGHIRAHRG